MPRGVSEVQERGVPYKPVDCDGPVTHHFGSFTLDGLGIIEQMVRNVSRVSREERSKRADGSAQDGNKTYCVMLVDVASLRILSSCCKVYDLLEDGVTGECGESCTSRCECIVRVM